MVTRGSTYDNRKNLPKSYFTNMIKKYEGTRIGRQELLAEILDDTPGALWRRDMIKTMAPETAADFDFKRVIIAIDPAVSTSNDSDETGIIVAAIDHRDFAYVLEDLSGRYQPHEWASIAIAAYKRHGADRIVAEVNNGGDMVESTLRMIDKNVSYRPVHASRGKAARAEPVSSLYEQGRVYHVGFFPQLEDQMTSFVPGQSASSPDRVDALVWALSDLVVGVQHSVSLVFGKLEGRDPLTIARGRLNTDHYRSHGL